MAERMSDAEAFRLAASLPPDAPHILGEHFFGEEAQREAMARAEAGDVPEAPGEVVAVIDIDEYEDDLRDPKWQEFQRAALEHVRKLRAEGRSV